MPPIHLETEISPVGSAGHGKHIPSGVWINCRCPSSCPCARVTPLYTDEAFSWDLKPFKITQKRGIELWKSFCLIIFAPLQMWSQGAESCLRENSWASSTNGDSFRKWYVSYWQIVFCPFYSFFWSAWSQILWKFGTFINNFHLPIKKGHHESLNRSWVTLRIYAQGSHIIRISLPWGDVCLFLKASWGTAGLQEGGCHAIWTGHRIN